MCAVQALRERKRRTGLYLYRLLNNRLRRCNRLIVVCILLGINARIALRIRRRVLAGVILSAVCAAVRALRSRTALLHACIRCSAVRRIGIPLYGLLDLILHTAVRRAISCVRRSRIRCRRAAAAYRAERWHQSAAEHDQHDNRRSGHHRKRRQTAHRLLRRDHPNGFLLPQTFHNAVMQSGRRLGFVHRQHTVHLLQILFQRGARWALCQMLFQLLLFGIGQGSVHTVRAKLFKIFLLIHAPRLLPYL